MQSSANQDKNFTMRCCNSTCLPFTSQWRWWGLLGCVGPGHGCLHLLSPAPAQLWGRNCPSPRADAAGDLVSPHNKLLTEVRMDAWIPDRERHQHGLSHHAVAPARPQPISTEGISAVISLLMASLQTTELWPMGMTVHNYTFLSRISLRTQALMSHHHHLAVRIKVQ